MLFQDPNAALDSIVDFSDTPDDGETGVDPNIILNWGQIFGPDPSSGVFIPATSYDVYFDLACTSCNDICQDVQGANNSDPQFVGNQPGTSFFPGPLDVNTTYCWRIDGVVADANGTNVPFLPPGPALSFTTWEDGPNVIFDPNDPNSLAIAPGSIIRIDRRVDVGGGVLVWLVADFVEIPPGLVFNPTDPNIIVNIDIVNGFQRDIGAHKWIKRLWSGVPVPPTLGHSNGFSAGVVGLQTRIENGPFRNIGEIGMAFSKGAYFEFSGWDPSLSIGYSGLTDEEHEVRIDLRDPYTQRLFQYMTVFDPTIDGIDNDGDGLGGGSGIDPDELKIPGRININTAPWYVIAQLPWVSESLAQAIVAYRDKLDISFSGSVPGAPDYYQNGVVDSREQAINPTTPPVLQKRLREDFGFASTGELNSIVAGITAYRIDRYALDVADQPRYPDLRFSQRSQNGGDGLTDDFEERDLIFARISDLVTVRSDIFTAYILVRLGTDGPQQRVIAILDRSDVYPDSTGLGGTVGNVKVLALYPVPDPR